MNIRQIKLALTVDLMNRPGSQSPLVIAQQAMSKFKSEAGKFTGLLFRGKSRINGSYERQTYALLFENCTLDLNLLTDQNNQSHFIQSFNLTPNLS